MERRKFTREFKLEAVRLIRERGVSYVQASQDLRVHVSQLRDWVKKVTKLKAERDILKNARRSPSSCGHRNGLRYVLSAPRGAAVGFLVASTP